MDSKIEQKVKLSGCATQTLTDKDEPITKKAKLEDEKINSASLTQDKNVTIETNNSENAMSKNGKLCENTKTFETNRINKNNEKCGASKNNDDGDDEMNVVDIEIPEPGFDYPIERDASDMLEEVDDIKDGSFPTVTERYLTPYYQLDVLKPGDDICVLVHSNRICMITLAPSHVIFQENKKIVKCDYKVSEKLDRTKNKTSGKAKHGAQPLQHNANLCRLTCDDESIYAVKCCMIGKLMEVNENLLDNPELLRKPPHHGGWIAIVLANLKHLDNTKKNLLTQELYEEALKKRKEKNEIEKNKVDKMEVEEGNKREKIDDNYEEKSEIEDSIKEEHCLAQVIDKMET